MAIMACHNLHYAGIVVSPLCIAVRIMFDPAKFIGKNWILKDDDLLRAILRYDKRISATSSDINSSVWQRYKMHPQFAQEGISAAVKGRLGQPKFCLGRLCFASPISYVFIRSQPD